MDIFTIGYTSFLPADFINVLHHYGIKCLVDVRSMPYSQYHSEYNKETLEEALKKNGIVYRHYAAEFGARQENRVFYGPDGILDFEKFIRSDEFQSGIEKIKKGMEIGYTFALMCAEKDPINCHRAIMVGQGFKKAGFSVKHIRDTGEVETQEALEQRILDMYFKDRDQISLFSADERDDEDLIEKGYVLRNKDIGYHIDGSKDEEELE